MPRKTKSTKKTQKGGFLPLLLAAAPMLMNMLKGGSGLKLAGQRGKGCCKKRK